MITRGFTGRQQPPDLAKRIPPGQHLVEGFPVLSASATPSISTDDWTFELKDGPRPLEVGPGLNSIACLRPKSRATSVALQAGRNSIRPWEGVLIDDIFAAARIEAKTPFLLAHSYDGYSTNIPLADLAGGKAMVALRYEGRPLERDHGGPARLLVPHLYFWKSAKWVKALQFTRRDEAGFWETHGYHMRGDPWREQRYTND